MDVTREVLVPDIGDFKDVPVIDVAIKTGDVVKRDDTLITLESDKATMDVPAPFGGVVKTLRVKVGDKVSQGSPIAVLEGEADTRPAISSATARDPSPVAASTRPSAANPFTRRGSSREPSSAM